MFLMWLGEQITERGVGNGISMIILGSIVAGIPGAIGDTAGQINSGAMSGLFAIVLIVVVLAVTAFCVFVERAQRRIPGRLRQEAGWPPPHAGADHAPAVQAQHVGRDPADLRLEPAAVPGDDCRIRRPEHRHLVGTGAADILDDARLRRAAAHDAVRGA